MLTRRSAHITYYGHEMQISTFAVCKLNMLQYLMKVKYTSHNNMVTCFSLNAIFLVKNKVHQMPYKISSLFLSVVYALVVQD